MVKKTKFHPTTKGKEASKQSSKLNSHLKKAEIKSDTQAPKAKVAIRSITGCAGCQLTIYYVEDILLTLLEKVDLVAAPMIKEENYEGEVDISFVEGSVTFTEDIEKIKEWRAKSKIIVAIGACAGEGGVQQEKQFIDKAKAESYVYKKDTKFLKSVDPSPLSDHIKVDYYIKGCPVDKQEIIWFLKQVLAGKEPQEYEKPVCHECKLRENYCLLEQGRDCYGPITYGNCSIMCPDFNHACTGCRGPVSDGNFQQFMTMLEEKGYSQKVIVQRMQKYSGVRLSRLIDAEKAKNQLNKPKTGNREVINMLILLKDKVLSKKKRDISEIFKLHKN